MQVDVGRPDRLSLFSWGPARVTLTHSNMARTKLWTLDHPTPTPTPTRLCYHAFYRARARQGGQARSGGPPLGFSHRRDESN